MMTVITATTSNRTIDCDKILMGVESLRFLCQNLRDWQNSALPLKSQLLQVLRFLEALTYSIMSARPLGRCLMFEEATFESGDLTLWSVAKQLNPPITCFVR